MRNLNKINPEARVILSDAQMKNVSGGGEDPREYCYTHRCGPGWCYLMVCGSNHVCGWSDGGPGTVCLPLP